MLEIVLSNGAVRIWNPGEYTNYLIKGRFLVVQNNEQWVGMYGLSDIVSLEVRDLPQ